MKTILPIIILSFLPLNAYSAETAARNEFRLDLSLAEQGAALPVSDPLPEISQPPPDSLIAGRDLTEDFKLAWSGGLQGRYIPELRNYKVILVPGFLSNMTTRPVTILGVDVRLGEYFSDQMKTLKELGVEYKLADIESEASPAINAAVIAKEIEASDKPVILLGHSKGGLDILETLISRKDLHAKVKGVVTIQTPFFGSPIADYVLQNKLLGKLARHLLKDMGGSIDSLVSLDTGKRARYYRENLAAINNIVNTVPMVNLGTWKDEEKPKLDTVLEPLRDEMLEMGLKNDGQVPLSSAVLPGADHVKVEGMDHFVTVMRTGSILKCDRARLTRTLLSMILAK